MRFQITFFTAIFAFAIALSGCSSDNSTNSTNVNSANKTANLGGGGGAKDSNNPTATTKTPEAATSNNAPTLAPVVAAYYEALKKKDDAALRKIYSQDTFKSLQADMKEEKKTSLVEYITETEPVPDKPFEVRNEQIQGDEAVAEMRGGSYPNGIKVKFVKEKGEWKITNESPELQSVKQSANDAKTAK